MQRGQPPARSSIHEHARVPEHAQPRRIPGPVARRPAQVGAARRALGVRHQDGDAAVLAGQACDQLVSLGYNDVSVTAVGVDQAAAVEILQGWLDARRAGMTRGGERAD